MFSFVSYGGSTAILPACSCYQDNQSRSGITRRLSIPIEHILSYSYLSLFEPEKGHLSISQMYFVEIKGWQASWLTWASLPPRTWCFGTCASLISRKTVRHSPEVVGSLPRHSPNVLLGLKAWKESRVHQHQPEIPDKADELC